MTLNANTPRPNCLNLQTVKNTISVSKQLYNKVYLVIGATEMVGAHLTCAMLRQGLSVRVAKAKGDDPAYIKHVLSFYTADYEGQFNEIEWADIDYDDITSLQDAMQGVCTVFCCKIPNLLRCRSINDNVLEIKNILNAAQESDLKGFVYLSSYRALGEEPDDKEVNEQSQRNPKGKYIKFDIVHYRCEMEVRRAMEEGLNASILAPTVVLGPGNWITDTSHLIPETAQRRYFTYGVTGFVGVNDVVKCLMSLARNKIYGEKFIANSQNMSFLTLFNIIAQKMSLPAPTKLASKWIIRLYKFCHGFKSIFTGRRPIVNEPYIDSVTHYRLYDGSKSVNRLIAAYETIDSVVDTIAGIYKKEQEGFDVNKS